MYLLFPIGVGFALFGLRRHSAAFFLWFFSKNKENKAAVKRRSPKKGKADW